MNKKVLWIIIAVVLIGLLVGAYFLYDHLQKQEGGQPTLPVEPKGEKLNRVPDFTVYDAQGKAYKLSDFFGKPIVLNLWASWCSPCKNEMPGFQQMYEEYGDEVHFLMVNVTGIDTKEDGQTFVRDSGYSFPVYYDTDNSMATNYYAGSVPMTYFIGSDGELVTYATGAISAEILEQGIGMIKE